MDCHLFEMLIQRYHDGELDAVESAEYERHRDLCGECRKMDEEYSGVFAVLRTVPLFTPSADFNEKVMARVDVNRFRVPVPQRAANAVGSGWNRLPAFVRVAVSVTAVFTVFVTIYRPFLYFLLSMGQRLATIATSGLMLLRDFGDRSVIIVEHLKTTGTYRLAWETFLRIAQKLLGDVPVTLVAATAAVFIVILIVVAGRGRFAGSKGGTHVGMF